MLYYVDKLPNFIDIGEEAENIAVDVSFDLTAWVEMHGPGAGQLLVQRPQDTNPYPAVTTTADDVLSWKPTQTDTAFVGRGKIQLLYSTADEVLEKSPIIYIMAGDSLEGAGDPPEPYEDWIDSLTDLASETLINAQAAANSADAAEDAKDDAVNAKTAAENAQLAAETAQDKAEGFADDAEASAGDAAGYASDASGYATAAEAAKEAVENMTVTASVDANVGTPSVDVTKTEIGGVVNIDLDFHNLKGADGVSPTNAVTDVQVAGTSVVSEHVANIPYADISTPGVIKVNADYGVALAGASKFPYINAAVTGGIQPGSSAYRPIVPKYQHEAVFYGLSKAAGVDLANETVTVGTYPATSKAAIKTMLGVPDDAGDIAYDESETYPADTVGSEISAVKSAIDSTNEQLVWRLDWGNAVEVVPSQTVSFSADGDNYKHSGALNSFNLNDEVTNMNTNVYAVTWDGTEYVDVLWRFFFNPSGTTTGGKYCLGNSTLLGVRNPHSSQSPFFFHSVYSSGSYVHSIYTADTAASHTISVRRVPVIFGNIREPYQLMVSPGTTATGIVIGGAVDSGNQGMAAGLAAQSTGSSIAIGTRAKAEATSSIAIGLQAKTQNSQTVAIGAGTNAYKDSTAVGHMAAANNDRSTAIGFNVDAESVGQTVLGAYNVVDSAGTYSLIVGDGTGDNARHNLLTVAPDGTIVSGGKRIAFVDETPVTVSGTTPTIAAEGGVRYVCGECATLTVTVPASGIVDVIFQSGSTPTVLTVTPPTGMTMSWAGGFDPTALESNTTYEINIADGCLGVAVAWT